MLSCEFTLQMKLVHGLASKVQSYLHEVLGVQASLKEQWAGQEDLPYFVRDAYDFHQLTLLGHTVLLALDRHPAKPSPSDIRLQMDKVRAVAGQPVVYVAETLASHERKRLIEKKVPFVVPGNQLYLPDLGLDLREYFRQRPGSAEKALSPSAQAMLIAALLRPRGSADWHPVETASALGYTSMTLSRAVRELAAAGLAHAHKAGRSQYLTMAHSPSELWALARPVLRSPVQRTLWVEAEALPRTASRIAGLSALAHLSMLADPRIPVVAMSRIAWQLLKPDIVEIPEPAPKACELQLWNYSPALLTESDTVDPLSLMLSLRDDTDERVQGALNTLDEHLPW